MLVGGLELTVDVPQAFVGGPEASLGIPLLGHVPEEQHELALAGRRGTKLVGRVGASVPMDADVTLDGRAPGGPSTQLGEQVARQPRREAGRHRPVVAVSCVLVEHGGGRAVRVRDLGIDDLAVRVEDEGHEQHGVGHGLDGRGQPILPVTRLSLGASALGEVLEVGDTEGDLAHVVVDGRDVDPDRELRAVLADVHGLELRTALLVRGPDVTGQLPAAFGREQGGEWLAVQLVGCVPVHRLGGGVGAVDQGAVRAAHDHREGRAFEDVGHCASRSSLSRRWRTSRATAATRGPSSVSMGVRLMSTGTE